MKSVEAYLDKASVSDLRTILSILSSAAVKAWMHDDDTSLKRIGDLARVVEETISDKEASDASRA